MQQHIEYENTLFNGLKNYLTQNYEIAEQEFRKIYTDLDTSNKILYINTLYANQKKDAVTEELQKLLNDDFLLEISAERTFSESLKNDETLWKPFKEKALLLREEIIISKENPKLCKKLIEVYEKDQLLRKNASELLRKNKGKLSQEFMAVNAKMGKIDEENIAYIKEHILCDTCKFPTIEEVGEAGMSSIFYVLQHSDEVELKYKYLEKLAAREPLSIEQQMNRMFIIDRMKLRKVGVQVYGTQYKFEENRTKIKPIESIEFANKERLKLGMLTVEHFEEILNIKR